ncbi:MAG: acetyl-CoA C-acetyltransferase [Bdellovibrionales bacterium]|nr:acetyl-CoA C-acetyltransferase [Bdellovibrionales bacterium]
MLGNHLDPKREIVIVAGARTPFAKFCGSYSSLTATDLAVHASKAAVDRSQISVEQIDHVIMGNVMQSSRDAAYLARHVGLRVGIPKEIPAYTVNRLCGSGFQALINAAHEILLGRAKIVLAGGSENMTQTPHVIRGYRHGFKMGPSKLEDALQEGLTDSYNRMPMAITAENLAKQYKISRAQCDEFALQSQLKTQAAFDAGYFKDEICQIEVPAGKGKNTLLDRDEHPRRDMQLKDVEKLPPVFQKDGVVTAGNASGICDGAAALIVTSKYEAQRRDLPILGEIKSYGVTGCDPDIMGIGPVAASRKALLDFGKTLKDMDLIEVNEAFASQTLAVVSELGIDQKKLNVNGGAIAIGHPLGASGSRIALSSLLELRRRQQRWTLVSACIGGGQGIAMILENPQWK